MRVVAGLGNPGLEYARSRHNAGFMVVRELALRWNVPLQPRGVALEGIGRFAGEEVHLLMPQTYMNRSGLALSGRFPEPPGEHLIVAHDDVDLPVGVLRIRPSGGSGGHRGVSSIIDTCGSDFVRVRVGVGRPPDDVDTADWVLAEMTGADYEELKRGVRGAAEAVECIVTDGVTTAMNRFNRKALPPSR